MISYLYICGSASYRNVQYLVLLCIIIVQRPQLRLTLWSARRNAMDETTSGSECARLARAGSTLRVRPRPECACDG